MIYNRVILLIGERCLFEDALQMTIEQKQVYKTNPSRKILRRVLYCEKQRITDDHGYYPFPATPFIFLLILV